MILIAEMTLKRGCVASFSREKFVPRERRERPAALLFLRREREGMQKCLAKRAYAIVMHITFYVNPLCRIARMCKSNL